MSCYYKFNNGKLRNTDKLLICAQIRWKLNTQPFARYHIDIRHQSLTIAAYVICRHAHLKATVSYSEYHLVWYRA